MLSVILSLSPEIYSNVYEIDFSSKNFYNELKRSFRIKEEISPNKNFLETLFKKAAKNKYLVIKRPTAIFYLDVLKEFFPNIKIINLIRDGRDSTLSLFKTYHFKWRYNFACKQWKRCINLKEKYREETNYYELKYEDLIKSPLKEVSGILKFLNKKKIPKNKLLNFPKYFKHKEKITQRRVLDTPFSKKAIGKWEKELSEEQKKIFKKIAGDELIKLGYEKNENW
jgi:hypothetical protein